MRFIFVSLFSLVFSELVLGIERYSDTYDDIDVDSIIKSDRLLIQYVNCILDKGPCTVDGRSLKCKYYMQFVFYFDILRQFYISFIKKREEKRI